MHVEVLLLLYIIAQYVYKSQVVVKIILVLVFWYSIQKICNLLVLHDTILDMNEDTSKVIKNINKADQEQKPDDFGHVIDALHTKTKLSSLRTYQGDVAEYVKDKQESVISIAVKEKERQEEREKDPLLKPEKIKTEHNFLANVKMISIAVLLLFLGGGISFYVFKYLKDAPNTVEVAETSKIIPFNRSTKVALNASLDIKSELQKISGTDGVEALLLQDEAMNKISDIDTILKNNNITIPLKLGRTLKNEYELGVFNQKGSRYNFLIITVSDFGQAFSGMLEWEATMKDDLKFIAKDKKEEDTSVYEWKDVIIKNKDSRGFVNTKEESLIGYTFLDKNTIIIVSSIEAISDLSSMYASRSVAR